MDSIVASAEKNFSQISNPIINNSTVSIIITFLAFVSTVLIVDSLPTKVKKTFTHPVVLFIILFINLYSSNNNLFISIGFSAAIVGVFYYIHNIFSENFELVAPESNVHPGCSKVTVEDLVKIFDNDKELLAKAMYAAGIPVNLKLSDSNAPLIATYLINSDYKVTESCQAPQ